ncbi:MAG: response regulator [Candidatus Nealsonbacteria bacterium]|nr:response regulator [Candidatus Nealsonbacteria bacterium]
MKKIFLVEDDEFLIDIYITKLKESGFETEFAKDGKSALEFLKKEKPDLLVLDLVLPDIDGLDLLREIKKEDRFQSLPVIILSNLDKRLEEKDYAGLGVTKYLIKANHKPSEIVEEIKKIIQ